MSESKDMLVSTDRMRATNGDQLMDPEDVRELYEAELSRLRAERDEAMHLLRAAKDGQIENNGLWHTMIHVEEFLSKHSKEGQEVADNKG